MNFHSYEKQIFKSFSCTEIRNDSKWTKLCRKEVMRTQNQQQRLTTNFPYHVDNQSGFDNPFINGRGFIYLGISMITLMINFVNFDDYLDEFHFLSIYKSSR